MPKTKGFNKLVKSLESEYLGRPVPKQYQNRYGKTYSEKDIESFASKSGLIVFLSIAFFIAVCMIGGAVAVECNDTSNIYADGYVVINSTGLVDGCTLSASANYRVNISDQNQYQLNGSFTGAIQIASPNVILDCNGLELVGNISSSTGTQAGIYATGRENVTVKNCVIKNYSYGIRLRNAYNNSILNNNISLSRYGINIDTSGAVNNTIQNNIVYDSFNTGIHLSSGSGHRVLNNNITKTGLNLLDVQNSIKANISFNNLDGLSVTNTKVSFQNSSSFYFGNNNGSGLSYLAYVVDTNIFTLQNNYGYNTTQGYGFLIENSYNGNILNNTLILNDRAINIGYNSSNILIFGNVINDSFKAFDNFYVGIKVTSERSDPNRTNNITITNNQLNNFGCTGILFRDMDNSEISNNVFYTSLPYLLTQNFNCKNGEPNVDIFAEEIYKGYIPAGTQAGDGYSISSIHYSENITINGNTHTNSNVYLRTQGILNLTTDLINYKFISYQLPYLLDKDNFYIPSSFNNVSVINPAGSVTIYLQQGISGNQSLNYSFTKDYEYYANINTFNLQLNKQNISTNWTVYSLTNSQYLFTSTSSSRNSYNYTLAPNEEIQIQDYGCVVPDNNLLVNYSSICTGNSNNSYFNINKTSDFMYVFGNSLGNFTIQNYVSALIYYTNGTIINSSLTGDINITLPAGNGTYALNNFNLTDGVTRENSPLWISSSTKTKTGGQWRIASNITDSINVLTVLDTTPVQCDQIKNPTMIPKDASAFTPSYTCTGTYEMTITNAIYNPSSESNVISFGAFLVDQDFCSSVLAGYLSFNIWETILALLAVVVLITLISVVLYSIKSYESEGRIVIPETKLSLDGAMLKAIFIWILVVVLLIIISLVTIGNLCAFS